MKLHRLAWALAAVGLASTAYATPPETKHPNPEEAAQQEGRYQPTQPPGADEANKQAQGSDPTVPAETTPGAQRQDTTAPGMGAEPNTAQTQAIPANYHRALDLPAIAMQLRAMGVPEGEVEKALKAFQDANIPAFQAAEALVLVAMQPPPQNREVLKNFGDAVEEQVESGLRGQQLAQGILQDLQQRAAEQQPQTGATEQRQPAVRRVGNEQNVDDEGLLGGEKKSEPGVNP